MTKYRGGEAGRVGTHSLTVVEYVRTLAPFFSCPGSLHSLLGWTPETPDSPKKVAKSGRQESSP